MADTLHKTLIIRLSSVGDIVLSSLLVRAFRKRFPSSRVDFLVKTAYAGLLAHNPNISSVLELPEGSTFRDLRLLRSALRRDPYDLIVDIHDSLRSRFLCLGAQRVVRVRKRKIARFLLVRTKINVYRHVGGAPNVAVRYLEPLREFGVEDDGGGLEVFISPEDDLRAGRALQALPDNGAPRMAVAPSARHPNKIWPADRFAAAASEVARRHGSGIVLLGSTAERERCGAVEQMVRERAPSASVANLAGELSLTETAGVLDRCAVVLTNDSGLMHLAAARRRPVIAVFGPTVREFGFFPFRTPSTVLEHAGLHCRPCTHIGLPDCPLGHFRCMNEIPAEAAVEAAERFLQAA